MKELELLRSKKRLTRSEREMIAQRLEGLARDAAVTEAVREFARNLHREPAPVQLVPVWPAFPTWPTVRPPDYWQPTVICSSDSTLKVN